MRMARPPRLNHMLAHRQGATIAIAAALLVVGITLFLLAGAAVWLKVFSGFLLGTGATRLVLLARRPTRATTHPPT